MAKRALCSLSLLAKRAVRELALTLRLAKRAVCDPSLSVDIRAVREFALRICYSTTKSMRMEDLMRDLTLRSAPSANSR